MNCPECREPLEPDAQFCPKCYARIEPQTLWQKFCSLFSSSAKPRRPLIQIKRTVTIKATDAQGQKHEYHSLEEAPPELRAEIEKLQAETPGKTLSYSSSDGLKSQLLTRKEISVFKIKDAQGNEKVYHSLEELPSEIRAAIEQAKKQANE
jgi:hypothetical protein